MDYGLGVVYEETSVDQAGSCSEIHFSILRVGSHVIVREKFAGVVGGGGAVFDAEFVDDVLPVFFVVAVLRCRTRPIS
jgi:hypothetical protein